MAEPHLYFVIVDPRRDVPISGFAYAEPPRQYPTNDEAKAACAKLNQTSGYQKYIVVDQV
jgi:hypothetical protein